MPATEGWGNISAQGARVGDPARRFRVRSVVLDQGLRLAVGDDLGPMDDIRAAFIEALGWSLLAFALLSLSGGLLLSFGFLRRVDAITRTADAIIAGELHRRSPRRVRTTTSIVCPTR